VTCILLLLLLIQCKISLYLGPVRTVRPVRCFVTPHYWKRRRRRMFLLQIKQTMRG